MDLPMIRRKDYNDQPDVTAKLEHASENNKYVLIHFSIIFSVLISLMLIGVLLYIYRRKLKNSFSENLNRVVHVSHITHPKNPDDGILDYYTNNYDDNYKISPEPELKLSTSPYSSMSNDNRNYFIYGKSSRIRSDFNDLSKRETNDVMKSNKKSPSRFNKSNSNIFNLKLTSILKPKINANQISSPLSSPSESIYDNGKASSLASTTTRVIPPIPTFSSNNHTQSKEILRGPQMISFANENDLIPNSSNAIITADTITTATVTTGASGAADSSNYNPILSFISKFKKNSPSFITSADNESTNERNSNKIMINEMTKEDDSNKIIINETTEVVDLDMFTINESYNNSIQDNSYTRLSREIKVFDKSPEHYTYE